MSTSPQEDEARPVRPPFVFITRGEDSVDRDDRVVFSDFTATILPADTPTDEVVEPEEVEVPKDSATDGAPSTQASTEPTEPTNSGPTVQTPADSGSSSSENAGTPTSSSAKNGG